MIFYMSCREIRTFAENIFKNFLKKFFKMLDIIISIMLL